MSKHRRHATVITIVAVLLIVPATAAAARSAGPPANDNRATPTSVEGLPASVSGTPVGAPDGRLESNTSMPVTESLPTDESFA